MSFFRLVLVFAFLCIAVSGLTPRVARADEAPRPIALVVTNNRSHVLSRPPLHYADDDGAKYYELFKLIANEDDVTLLTELDRDTAKLFPQLGPKTVPPTKQNLNAAIDRIAQRTASSSAQRDVYFVFAGHGDIVDGKGAIELADGLFNADEVERALSRIGNARLHVILDSCNSFFVLSPRKPGGRHYTTMAEASAELKSRLPRAGVFLSTSAEAQVYEWSELQSGIFSHAVRSGLAGAADANKDGKITYRELRAFVSVSTGDVKNPKYRPQVYARGPNGNDDEVLFDLRSVKGTRLSLEGKGHRYSLRDDDDIAWADVFPEKGRTVDVVLPASIARVTIEEREPSAPGAPVVARYVHGEGGAPLPLLVAERGVNELFVKLFASPFGPEALRRSEEAHGELEPLGIADDDVARMRLLLDQASADARADRHRYAVQSFGMAAVFGIGLGLELARPGTLEPQDNGRTFRTSAYGTTGAILIGAGIYQLVRTADLERLARRFDERAATDPHRALAEADVEIARLAKEAATERRVTAVVGGVGAAFFAGSWIYRELREGSISNGERIFSYGIPIALMISFVGSSFIPTPQERLARLWKEDPSLRTIPRVGIAPAPGGAFLSLSGAF